MKKIIFLTSVSTALLLAGCGDLSQMRIAISNGGRAVAVAVNPADANQMVVASETGGLFRTTNAGDNWTQVTGNATFRFTDVIFYPFDPNIVVATADKDYKTVSGGGIWRSTNGGQSWSHVTLTTPDPACLNSIGAYALCYESSAHRIYAGTSCGLAYSDNGGANWTFMPVVSGYNNDVARAVQSPSAGHIFILLGASVKVTTDAGASWSGSSPAGLSFVSSGTHVQLAVSPANGNHIFWAFNHWVWNTMTSKWDPYNALYMSTDNGGSWNMIIDQGGSNRPPLVKITKILAGSPARYNLYFSDGGCQLKMTTVTHSSSPTLSAWTNLTSDHCDFSDFGFNTDGISTVLLTGDGGISRSTDGGITWALNGGGDRGYNALQITEVTGQLDGSDVNNTDLYFATQDNDIWASPDLGSTWTGNRHWEGFFLNIWRQDISDADTKFTGVSCSGCGNFISGPLLASQGGFPNPPNDAGNPFLLKPGFYIHNTQISGITANIFNLTTNNGGLWTPRYGFNEEVRALSQKSRFDDSTIVFTAARFPGSTSDGNEIVQIKRIQNVIGTGSPVVSDITGFGSLGIFPTMFAWYKPYGVEIYNPNHIILADITDNTMKYTTDGGTTWHPDTILTRLVTNSGDLKFRDGAFTQVTCYGFDPDCYRHILVGTAQSGVIQSFDAGASWERVAGTDVIPFISSFFFPGDSKVVISSYGRGLWTLRYSDCRPIRIPIPVIVDLEEPLIKWKGAYVPIRQIHDPDVCPVCGFIMVKGGRVTNIRMSSDNTKIEELFISSGEAKFYSWDKQEMQLPFKVSYSTNMGEFKVDDELAKLSEKLRVAGLYVEGNLYKGAIIYNKEMDVSMLPGRKIMGPNISLSLPTIGYIGVNEIRSLKLTLKKFSMNLPIELMIDGNRVEEKNIKRTTDKEGNIVLELQYPFNIGGHKITIQQKTEQGLTQDVTTFNVTTSDFTNK